ncbi:chromatin modification-related protein EAF7-domain-containing protein [Polychytrium aggregatum]|uniref:chromatin modification-related protein EAF7-domain-containing protein n=1 Tax=Polychytrium aggregatum TaxID=110093 RepID=UPI0022FE581E|nr:chromatin modification-related protein EAF7-domain-containing protein [Polychytrium aggregatum]KAI9205940.1 chromatin modification-related protein EAF7-domain-containing protein [Polychytrium aggregatum]
MADEHSSSDSTSISSVGSSSESTNHSPASPTHPPSKPSRHSLPTVHVDDDSRSIDDDDDELTDLSSASPTTEQTGIKWTPEMELVLFQAIFKYQPVGVHRRFRMISIMLHCERNMPIRVSRGDVWDRLESLYNLKELDRLTDETDAAEDTSGTFGSAELSISRSIYPFLVEQEFQLPFEDFEGLIAEHRKASTPESDAGDLASSQSSSSVRPSSSIEVSATDPGRGFRGGMQSPLSPRLAAQRLKNRPMSPVRIKTPELEGRRSVRSTLSLMPEAALRQPGCYGESRRRRPLWQFKSALLGIGIGRRQRDEPNLLWLSRPDGDASPSRR